MSTDKRKCNLHLDASLFPCWRIEDDVQKEEEIEDSCPGYPVCPACPSDDDIIDLDDLCPLCYPSALFSELD